jgi:hypothetical protein
MREPFLLFGKFNPNSVIIVILVAVAIFFLVREVICWYYKINDMVELLKSIDKKLDRLNYIEVNKSQPSTDAKE